MFLVLLFILMLMMLFLLFLLLFQVVFLCLLSVVGFVIYSAAVVSDAVCVSGAAYGTFVAAYFLLMLLHFYCYFFVQPCYNNCRESSTYSTAFTCVNTEDKKAYPLFCVSSQIP